MMPSALLVVAAASAVLHSASPPESTRAADKLAAFVGVWKNEDQESRETLTISADGSFEWKNTKSNGQPCMIAGKVAYTELVPPKSSAARPQLRWTMTVNDCNTDYQGRTTADWVVHSDAGHLALLDADPAITSGQVVGYTRQSAAAPASRVSPTPAGGRSLSVSANGTLETRHGVLYVLERRPDDADSLWELKLKGRVLARSDEKLEFWSCDEPPCLLTGDDGREYVLVAKASGGIACPYQFVVVELQGAGKARVSEEFGSCSDLLQTRLDGDTFTIEMPAYVPHPDLLTQAELRLRERTTEVYTYRNGAVTMKKKIGRSRRPPRSTDLPE